nr:hypothetical protein HK105_002531 [Polyrhizophydium stewartii]
MAKRSKKKRISKSIETLTRKPMGEYRRLYHDADAMMPSAGRGVRRSGSRTSLYDLSLQAGEQMRGMYQIVDDAWDPFGCGDGFGGTVATDPFMDPYTSAHLMQHVPTMDAYYASSGNGIGLHEPAALDFAHGQSYPAHSGHQYVWDDAPLQYGGGNYDPSVHGPGIHDPRMYGPMPYAHQPHPRGGRFF